MVLRGAILSFDRGIERLREPVEHLDSIAAELSDTANNADLLDAAEIRLREISDVFLEMRLYCSKLLCSETLLLCSDARNPDSPGAEIFEHALRMLSSYYAQIEMTRCEVMCPLVVALNELRVGGVKVLFSETAFSAPLLTQQNCVESDPEKRTIEPVRQQQTGENYLAFSQAMLSIYRNENRQQAFRNTDLMLSQLAASGECDGEVLLLASRVFMNHIAASDLAIGVAIKSVLEKIEGYVRQKTVQLDSQIQPEDSHPLLADLLFYLAVWNDDSVESAKLSREFGLIEFAGSLNNGGIATGAGSDSGAFYRASLSALYRSIAACKLAIDELARGAEQTALQQSLKTKYENLRDRLVVFGGPVACEFLDEAGQLLEQLFNDADCMYVLEDVAVLFLDIEHAVYDRHRGSMPMPDVTDLRIRITGYVEHDSLLIREVVADFNFLLQQIETAEQVDDSIVEIVNRVTSVSTLIHDSELNDAIASFNRCLAQALASGQKLRVLCERFLQVCSSDSGSDQTGLVACGINEIVSRATDSSDAVHFAAPTGSSTAAIPSINSASPLILGQSHKPLPDVGELGRACNDYIDIIQDALDSALGSSGNLTPDIAVARALASLAAVSSDTGVASMANLVESLAAVVEAVLSEQGTFNQSDTLLVQEAIIAITLGVDSLVNAKPLPDLIPDVTYRVTALSQNWSDGSSATDVSRDVFLDEASELLQRLFELLHRWRGSPARGGRIHGDIVRLVHSLMTQAGDVSIESLTEVSTALHALLAQEYAEVDASADQVELAIDAVDFMSEDVERIRNHQKSLDRSVLLQLLSANNTGPVSTFPSGSVEALDNSSSLSSNLPVEFGGTLAHSIVEQNLGSISRLLSQLKNSNGYASPDHAKIYSDLLQIQNSLREVYGGADTGMLNQVVVSEAKVHPGNKLQRLVSATAEAFHKQVRLEISDDDLALLYGQKPALVFLIETLLQSIVECHFDSVESRLKLGKSVIAAIQIVAKNTDTSIVIEIVDDGAGQCVLTSVQGKGCTIDEVVAQGASVRVINKNQCGTLISVESPHKPNKLKVLLLQGANSLFALPADRVTRVRASTGSVETAPLLPGLRMLISNPSSIGVSGEQIGETPVGYIVECVLENSQKVLLWVEDVCGNSELAFGSGVTRWGVHPLVSGAGCTEAREVVLLVNLNRMSLPDPDNKGVGGARNPNPSELQLTI